MRRTPSIEAVGSALYLRGISTNNFPEALEAILGENAKGLSPTNIVRLKEKWEDEFKDWNNRGLSEKHFVYFWADGIYFNVRLDDDRPCLLVIIGALSDGSKELVGIYDGCRESTISWSAALNDLSRRGYLSFFGYRRWGFGFLGCSRRSVPKNKNSTLLGSQDSEHPGQDAEKRPKVRESNDP